MSFILLAVIIIILAFGLWVLLAKHFSKVGKVVDKVTAPFSEKNDKEEEVIDSENN